MNLALAIRNLRAVTSWNEMFAYLRASMFLLLSHSDLSREFFSLLISLFFILFSFSPSTLTINQKKQSQK